MTLLIVSALFCAILSLVGGLIFFINDKLSEMAQTYALPFAAGTLLACAFFDLLPEAIKHGFEIEDGHGDFDQIMGFALVGFMLFLILDSIMNWINRCSGATDNRSAYKNTAKLMIICDIVHTVMDGIVIGVAFLASPITGLISTLAILSHEIPQEIGDFAILLKGGFKKKAVVIIQVTTTLILVPAGIIAYILGGRAESGMPGVLAVTAGFFIYLAACGIIPSLFKESDKRRDILRNIILLLLGIIVIGVILSLSAHGH